MFYKKPVFNRQNKKFETQKLDFDIISYNELE